MRPHDRRASPPSEGAMAVGRSYWMTSRRSQIACACCRRMLP